MVNLALAWAEAYQQVEPAVDVSVTGGGSGTGIAALINGTVDLANASRQIKPEEIEQARANGIEPLEIVVARDAIAVIVHRDNPVDHLTIEQLSAIYSGAINNWAEVGGADRTIVRLSRETNSGTHVYFLEEVLRLGEPDNRTLFATDTLLLPSSEGIAAEIAYNENAIGYDGLGYVTDEMKVVAVGEDVAGPFFLPSVDGQPQRARSPATCTCTPPASPRRKPRTTLPGSWVRQDRSSLPASDSCRWSRRREPGPARTPGGGRRPGGGRVGHCLYPGDLLLPDPARLTGACGGPLAGSTGKTVVSH
jgi:phosphate transport system substrate-binding protein